MQATSSARRRGVALLTIGLLVAASLVGRLAPGTPFGPAAVLAADEECKITPSLCATVTVSYTSNTDGYGHVYTAEGGAADGNIDCVRNGDRPAEGHCTTKYYIAGTSRTISLTGQSTPAGATDVCDAYGCSTNFIVNTFSLTRGQVLTRQYSMLLVNPVNVDVTRVGNGYVSSTPFGISCGTDCAQHLPGGYPVTLTAVPDNGSVFVGFSGHPDCFTKHLTCTFTPTVNTFITATFMVPTPPPTSTPAATATASPRPTGTRAPTKPPTAAPTPGTQPTPGGQHTPAAATASATGPAPTTIVIGPTPEPPEVALASPGASVTPGPTLPPIATRAPLPADPASGSGNMLPLLFSILVAVVITVAFGLLRARRSRARG